MSHPIQTPRLSRICLLAFVAALAILAYDVAMHRPYDLVFLLCGASGTLYLLLLGSEHFAAQQHYRSLPMRLRQLDLQPLPIPVATVERRANHGLADRRRPANVASQSEFDRRKQRRSTLAPIC